MARFDVARWDEPTESSRRSDGPSGDRVRRELLRPAAGAEGLEHNETQTNQEEVYVYVRGSALPRLDGREIEVGEGMAVRVDPEVTREPVAGDGACMGRDRSAREGKYEPPSWVGLAPCTRSSSPTRSCASSRRHCGRTWTTSGNEADCPARIKALLAKLLSPRPKASAAAPRPLDLADSKTTIEELRRYLRDESVDAFEDVPGLCFKAWISDEASERWGAVYLWESREDASRSC